MDSLVMFLSVIGPLRRTMVQCILGKLRLFAKWKKNPTTIDQVPTSNNSALTPVENLCEELNFYKDFTWTVQWNSLKKKI